METLFSGNYQDLEAYFEDQGKVDESSLMMIVRVKRMTSMAKVIRVTMGIRMARMIRVRRVTSMAALKKRLFPWTKAKPLPRGDQTAVLINITSIYIYKFTSL